MYRVGLSNAKGPARMTRSHPGLVRCGRTTIVLALVVVSTQLTAPLLTAQDALPGPATNEAIEVVIASALGELTSPLARAIVSGESFAVEIEVPDSSPAWQHARDRMMRALAGRRRVEADRRYLRVMFEGILIEADTLRASYHVDWMEFCAPNGELRERWAVTGTHHRIRSVRQHGSWPRVTVIGAGYTDDWCMVAVRPR